MPVTGDRSEWGGRGYPPPGSFTGGGGGGGARYAPFFWGWAGGGGGPWGRLGGGINFWKGRKGRARNRRWVGGGAPRGCEPSNAASRSCSDAESVGPASPAAAGAPATRRRRARISVTTPRESTPAGASHNSAVCQENGGLSSTNAPDRAVRKARTRATLA